MINRIDWYKVAGRLIALLSTVFVVGSLIAAIRWLVR